MKYLLLVIIYLTVQAATAQDPKAFTLFDKTGKVVKFSKMIDEVSKAQVILFGEVHNDAMAHWLELKVLKALYLKDAHLVLGMEMFEADNQLVLDEYLQGVIEEKHLIAEAKVWENYKTDYKPLVDFCKEKKLAAIASNIPRRYASLVFRKGIHALDTLPDQVKNWMVKTPFPLDTSLPGYKALLGGMGDHAQESGMNMVFAQAIKDATMAHFILQKKYSKVLHINGSYHSQNGEGIIWYLKKIKPEIKIATIHIAEQESIEILEEENKAADYIFCIPQDMAKSY